MIERSASDLQFVRSREPIPTVEVDLYSFPDGPDDFLCYGDLLVQALQPIASASPKMRASLYVYYGQSVNFHTPTNSAFIGVAGNKKLLEPLLAAFKKISGVKARFSDYIDPSSGRCEFHIQEGRVWCLNTLGDDLTWFAEVK